VLADLKDGGPGQSLPGGGAEVFDDRVHDEAFKGKIRSDKWFDVHDAAHELGLMSNATILYGHIESIDDRLHAPDDAARAAGRRRTGAIAEGWPGPMRQTGDPAAVCAGRRAEF
jgi:2-iminoacetate synthase ThiH